MVHMILGCKKISTHSGTFKKKLKDLGHYPTSYASIEDLKLQFQHQLDTLIDEDKI